MNKADPKSQGEFLRIEEERRYKAQNGLWRKWGRPVHAWATWRVARLRMGLWRCEIGAGIRPTAKVVPELPAGSRQARLAMGRAGPGERHLLSLLRGHRMKRLLRRMLDESEFLCDYGVRAISKSHEANPYVFGWCGTEMGVGSQPAESNSGLFGGTQTGADRVSAW